ncbi:MAG TPA: TRAP transporter small permease subunit [Syntrophales bacterium]|nr:TRAP transporter small permease subunit [Syntrophales bacterium]HPQ45269.1 TRAP transporter small permease subunit [Syntrophales bacterium]
MMNLIASMERMSRILNKLLIAIAGLFLVAMMSLAGANVVLRSFGVPVKGTFELMGLFGAVVAAFALAKTQIERQHIAVDVLIRVFPAGVKRALCVVKYLIGAIFFILAAWQTGQLGTNLWQVHELSETLRIAYFPFVYAVSLGCVMIALVLIIELLKVFNGEGETKS